MVKVRKIFYLSRESHTNLFDSVVDLKYRRLIRFFNEALSNYDLRIKATKKHTNYIVCRVGMNRAIFKPEKSGDGFVATVSVYERDKANTYLVQVLREISCDEKWIKIGDEGFYVKR